MSKARLVIMALLTEGQTVAEVAARYGVHRSWVYRLKARYEHEGDAAFEPRSRRPRSSPTAVAETTVQLVLRLRKELADAGLDAGADTLCWHLKHHHQVVISRATAHRILVRHAAVTADPAKRPKSSYLRFEADLPNETWQSDFTHYRLTRPDGRPGSDIEIITWLDDHSRYALHVSAHSRVTAQIVHATFTATAATYGDPASTLTDNGMVYTVRFAGGRGGRTRLEVELRQRGITQKNSRPNHPSTCGKVERFQQTLKRWLRAQAPQPATITELQALLDTFRQQYNHHRPHRSLPHQATPAAAYAARPKAFPGDRTSDTHDRVRSDKVSKTGNLTLRHNGRLHHIGIGRTHAGTYVRLLIQDLHITIVNTATGRDPARAHPRPQPRLPATTPQTKQQWPYVSVGPLSPMS